MVVFGFLIGPLTEQASSAGGSYGVCDLPGAFLSESPTISDVRLPFEDVEEEDEGGGEEENEEELAHDDEEEETNDPLEDSTGGLPSESTQVG